MRSTASKKEIDKREVEGEGRKGRREEGGLRKRGGDGERKGMMEEEGRKKRGGRRGRRER